MGIARDMVERCGDALAGAKELGRGLMRGDRRELKLGYTAANATLAVIASFKRDEIPLGEEHQMEVLAHLVGFSHGMRDEPKFTQDGVIITGLGIRPELLDSYEEGFNAGQDTDITKVYPGEGDSPDAPPVGS